MRGRVVGEVTPAPADPGGVHMSETESVVIRTWLRDGTQNEMSLHQAIDNLVHNQSDAEGSADERREAIRRYLLAGRTLRTRHATFALKT